MCATWSQLWHLKTMYKTTEYLFNPDCISYILTVTTMNTDNMQKKSQQKKKQVTTNVFFTHDSSRQSFEIIFRTSWRRRRKPAKEFFINHLTKLNLFKDTEFNQLNLMCAKAPYFKTLFHLSKDMEPQGTITAQYYMLSCLTGTLQMVLSTFKSLVWLENMIIPIFFIESNSISSWQEESM